MSFWVVHLWRHIAFDILQTCSRPRSKILTHVFFVALGFAAAIASGRASDTPRRVVLLEGLTPTQAAAAETEQAFKQRLKERSSQPIEVSTDFLDLGRFQGQEAESRLVQFLSAKFNQTRPDLIVPISRSAVMFVARHRDEFVHGVPVVYCCTPISTVEPLNLPPDLPGVVVEYDWKGTFDLARRLQPTAKTLVIVSGGSELGLAWQKDVIRLLQPDLRNYDIRYVTSLREEERLEEVSHLPRNSILILMPIFGEELTGRGPTELATNLAKASSAPAYSPVPTLLGGGIVGGNMDNYTAQANKVADFALEILSGKAPATLPHETRLALRIRVDARQLERWGLSEKSLPQGTSVEFRQPTLWEQYRITVILVLLAFAVLAGIIALMLLQDHKRRAAEKLLKESEDRLEATADARRNEMAHILRVAVLGELSDGMAHELGQPLSAIMLNAQAAQKLLAGQHHDKAVITQILGDIVEEDTRASDVLHRLRRLLKKGEHQSSFVSLNDLITSTLGLCHSELMNKRIKVETALIEDLPLVWGDPVQLQQVLLNLIMNGVEAMASIPPAQRMLSVGSRISDGCHVKVSITNYGRGLSADELKLVFQPYFSTKERGLGLGLSICCTIVGSHGGSLTLSNAGGGVTAVVSLPVPVQVASAS